MKTLTVTEVNKIIKNDIDNDIVLRNLSVSGEISNFKAHTNGHFYFSLKDNESKINCVMFYNYASKINFKIEDGMKVVVTCSTNVYVAGGSYSLSIYSMEPFGLGSLFLEFEQLKAKLNEEGLFDEQHKSSIPKFPLKIGVISAKEGAAIKDVITTIKRRWPICEITLIPSLVQGRSASEEVNKSLIFADSLNFDTIIVARGGGSIEDLWCFNDETVARTVYNMKTPLISAIGHEIDYTIIDYVSDLRASTPTMAGELATPSSIEIENYLSNIKIRLINSFKSIVDICKNRVNALKDNPYLSKAENIFINYENKLMILSQRLINCETKMINDCSTTIKDYYNSLINVFEKEILLKNNKLKNIESKLDALSPLKVMTRGYGIISKDEKTISSVKEINIDDELSIMLSDGSVKTKVKEIKEK